MNDTIMPRENGDFYVIKKGEKPAGLTAPEAIRAGFVDELKDMPEEFWEKVRVLRLLHPLKLEMPEVNFERERGGCR